MAQLILHLWGDYILQTSWMANNKTKSWLAALVHASVYSVGFFLIASPWAVLVIWSTHAVIDRYRLARHVCWGKEYLTRMFCKVPPWEECSGTGYHKDAPPWLTTWLMIIGDNTLHLTINFLAISYL